MTVSAEGIGAAVLRKEDARFLTGRGRYTDDVDRAGHLHAVFVRSPHAHADILAVDVASARVLPGVAGVFVGADLVAGGVQPLGLDFIAHWMDGRPMDVPERRALAVDRVRYVGEPVAVVVADSLDGAKDAAEAVVVRYAELPVIVDPAATTDPDAPQLWPRAPGNVACERTYGNAAEVDRLFDTAHRIVMLRVVNQRVAPSPMEPRVAVARFDAFEQKNTLVVSHQTPFPLQEHLCATLGIAADRMRVVSHDVGGGFGVKGPAYPEEVALVWLAGQLGTTVRWRCERSELFLSDAQARDHVTTLEMAVDADGRFLALRVDDVANLGAYVSSFGAGPPVFAQVLLAAGPYLTRAICGRVRMVYTNTMPTDAYRGPGRAECTYMLERMADRVARALDLSPAEVRRRNLIPAARMPYASPLGRTYDSGDFARGFEMALERADVAGFAARQAEARARGCLRGLGLSSYLDHTGMGPSDVILSRGMRFGAYESAQVRFNPQGGVVVHTGTHSHGQGLETALAQLVADRFGVPLAQIDVRHGDTDDLGYGRGTVGARSLLAGGSAIGVALDKVEAKGRRIAAHLLECAVDDVTFERGVFRVAGTDRTVDIRAVAREAYFPRRFPLRELEPGLDESGYWDPPAVSLPNGTHVCEVEIDAETGVVRIVRFVSIDDFGNVVNPMLVAGQVHGGLAQGIGQAALERVVFDPASGQLLTGSLADYALPRADDLPSFETGDNPHPTATNPLGVKGCGEVGVIGAPPAYVNAVLDALAHLGVTELDMPVTSESVWRAMHRNEVKA